LAAREISERQKEIDRSFSEWFLQDVEREVLEGYPLIRNMPCYDAKQVMRYLSDLTIDDRIRTVRAMCWCRLISVDKLTHSDIQLWREFRYYLNGTHGMAWRNHPLEPRGSTVTRRKFFAELVAALKPVLGSNIYKLDDSIEFEVPVSDRYIIYRFDVNTLQEKPLEVFFDCAMSGRYLGGERNVPRGYITLLSLLTMKQTVLTINGSEYMPTLIGSLVDQCDHFIRAARRIFEQIDEKYPKAPGGELAIVRPTVARVGDVIDFDRSLHSKLYQWSLAEVEREVREGYPSLRGFANPLARELLVYVESLTVDERVALARSTTSWAFYQSELLRLEKEPNDELFRPHHVFKAAFVRSAKGRPENVTGLGSSGVSRLDLFRTILERSSLPNRFEAYREGRLLNEIVPCGSHYVTARFDAPESANPFWFYSKFMITNTPRLGPNCTERFETGGMIGWLTGVASPRYIVTNANDMDLIVRHLVVERDRISNAVRELAADSNAARA
jgi:hypothetical protein